MRWKNEFKFILLCEMKVLKVMMNKYDDDGDDEKKRDTDRDRESKRLCK